MFKYNIILCDEPIGNLDQENKEVIAKLLKKISKDKLVIVVSHDISIWDNLYDQLIILDEGNIKTNEIILKESKNIESNINNNSNNPNIDYHFSFNLIKKISFNKFSPFKIKTLSQLVILILLLGLFYALTNIIMNNNYKTAYKYLIDNKVEAIDIYNKYEDNDKLYTYKEKYDGDIYYHNEDDLFLLYTKDERIKIKPNKVYIKDKINNRNIYGSDSLTNDSIIINKNILKNDINYEDLIGTKIIINETKLTITGIDLSDNESYVVYLNEETFNKLEYKTAYRKIKDKLGNIYDILNNISNIDEKIEGRFPQKDDEIVISYNLNKNNYNLNDSITFEFLNDDNIIKKTYTIVGFTSYSQRLLFNFDEYNEILKYNIYSIKRGLSVLHTKGLNFNNYTYELIKDVIEDDYIIDSNIGHKINYVIMSYNEYEPIMVVLFIFILFITYLFIISFLNNNLNSMKKEVGLFKSFYMTNKEIIKLLSFNVYILLIISNIIGVGISVFILKQLSKFLSEKIINWFNFKAYVPIMGIIIIFVLTIINLILFLYKLNKKSNSDIIEGRI